MASPRSDRRCPPSGWTSRCPCPRGRAGGRSDPGVVMLPACHARDSGEPFPRRRSSPGRTRHGAWSATVGVNGCSYIISAISIVNEGRAAGAAAASASHRIGLHVQSTQVHSSSSVGNEGSLTRLRLSGLHGVLRLCRSSKPTPACGLDPCSHAHSAE